MSVLQGVLTSVSDYLRRATDGRVYFHRVTIVVPPTWDSVSCRGALPGSSYTSRGAVNEATIRIGMEHPIFGQYPWTQQSRSCGLPGDFISVGYHYILQFNETENGIVGSSASSSSSSLGSNKVSYGGSGSSYTEPGNDFDNHYEGSRGYTSYDGNNGMGHHHQVRKSGSAVPAGMCKRRRDAINFCNNNMWQRQHYSWSIFKMKLGSLRISPFMVASIALNEREWKPHSAWDDDRAMWNQLALNSRHTITISRYSTTRFLFTAAINVPPREYCSYFYCMPYHIPHLFAAFTLKTVSFVKEWKNVLVVRLLKTHPSCNEMVALYTFSITMKGTFLIARDTLGIIVKFYDFYGKSIKWILPPSKYFHL